MIKSLRKKFILINMLLVAIVLIAVFSAQYITKYQQLQEESMRALEMALNWKEAPRPEKFEFGQPRPENFTRKVLFVAQMNQDGEIRLLSSENISISEEHLVEIVGNVPLSENGQGILKEYNLRYMVKSQERKGQENFTKIAFIDLTDDISIMMNMLITSVSSCVAALAAFFFISLYLSRWALRPVERAWEQQRRFVADSSHELKTPLTVILANTGILKANRTDTIEQQINWIENTEAEAKRMKKLIDNLLFLAKTDDMEIPVRHSRVNLSDVLFSTALSFESVAFERGVTLETSAIASDIHVSGNEEQLKQLIGIMLDNAVKYSGKDGTVILSLEIRHKKAAVTVQNQGSYLTRDDIEHIFERFYRADKSRSSEGYGLGLSIAKSIVDAHAGKISVQSDPAQGNAFIVILPLYD